MEDKKAEDKPKERKKLVVEEVDNHPQPQKETVLAHKENSKPPIPPDLAPPPVVPPTPKFNLLWIIVPSLLILAALVGGIFVYEQGVSRERARLTQTPEPTLESVSTPTPTPEAEKIDLSKYTIAIQNGSGIAGQATKIQNILTKAGFKVVSIGNAKTYDYEKTIIQAKKSVDENYLTQLSTLLGKTYTLGDGEDLLNSAKTDVVVIIGKGR